jgi:hypothetical protein
MTHGDYHDTLFGAWQEHAPMVGMAIAAAWMTLLLAGRFRLAFGWREWLGLALGAVWLANLLWASAFQFV